MNHNVRKRKLPVFTTNVSSKKEKIIDGNLFWSNTEKNEENKECIVILTELKHDFKNESFPVSSSYEPDKKETQFDTCEIFNQKLFNKSVKCHMEKHTKKVKCDSCQCFYSIRGFSRHKCEKTYCCAPCSKTFRSQYHLDQHMRGHALIEARKQKPKIFPCSICKKDIAKSNVKRHARIHERNGPKLYINNSIVKRTYNRKKNFICNICGKDLKHKLQYERHIQAHDNRKQYQCNSCEESFKFYVQLVRHLSQVHSKINSEKIKCTICKKEVVAIKNHLRTHIKCPTHCDICKRNLPNRAAFALHRRHHRRLALRGTDRPLAVRDSNREIKRFKCSACTKRFVNETELFSHWKEHGQMRIRSNHKCSYCPFNKSHSITELLSHIRKEHFGKGIAGRTVGQHLMKQRSCQYACEFCSEEFAGYPQYKTHLIGSHGMGELGTAAAAADRSRNPIQILTERYAVATRPNFRKIACLFCLSDVRVSHMRKHLQSHQMFVCILCQKRFSDIDSFQAHESRHEQMSVRCTVCSQTFISHVRLMAHLKRAHKIAFSSLKACPRCDINSSLN